MIASVERMHAVKEAEKMGVAGVVADDIKMDLKKFNERKKKIVETQRGGIGQLFKKNKINHVEGMAKFIDPHTIEIDKDGEKKKLRAKNFILSMGAKAIHLPINGLEGGPEDGVWTSDDAVTLPGDKVPKKMAIIGGGAVGSEFAYVYNGLGAEIHLVELMDTLCPMFDNDLGKELGRSLKKQGVNVYTESSVEKVEKQKNGWKVFIKTGDKTKEVEVDVVLMGVGRKANTDGMDLEKVGVKLHKKGVEVFDETLQTHCSTVYAIGDVRGHIQLAHVASAEGKLVAENIIHGKKKKMDWKSVPNAVYTHPEVASVGLTEAEAKEQGYDVTVGKFNFRPLGKAMADMNPDGFVKVVAEKKYGEVLGVHMIGAHVTDMIHEAVVAIKLEATLEYMVDTIHAHPTMAEGVLEAFEAADGSAIHA
jgi:dihydrolipoamide dehydrogenase